MVYQTDETSATDGRPLELYKFIGTYDNYLYTSASREITSSGEVYTPLFIQRNALKVGTQEQRENALEISMPFDITMVNTYAYQNAPPSLVMELRRAHETDHNDTVLLWKGRVTAFSVEGRVAKLRVPALFSYILEGNAPTPRFQAPCNHVLYDARCGVDPALHQHATTVTSIVGTDVALNTLPFGANEAAAGLIFNALGESRMVLSNVGTAITISYAFSTLSVGDPVTIRKGCDHALNGDCINRFNNGARFGGFPIVPDRNPFTSTLV